MKVLYLHGFRSSPDSTKARLLRDAMAARGMASEYLAPALDPSPARAIAQVEALCRTHAATGVALIGSSLGGYYATWMAEQCGCRAVLLNPGIHASRDLRLYLGEQTFFHDPQHTFVFEPAYLDELAAIDTPQVTQLERYFLVAATGDEVLDWREMVSKYAGARMKIIAGSDHGLSDFPNYLDEVLDFCLAPTDSAA